MRCRWWHRLGLLQVGCAACTPAAGRRAGRVLLSDPVAASIKRLAPAAVRRAVRQVVWLAVGRVEQVHAVVSVCVRRRAERDAAALPIIRMDAGAVQHWKQAKLVAVVPLRAANAGSNIDALQALLCPEAVCLRQHRHRYGRARAAFHAVRAGLPYRVTCTAVPWVVRQVADAGGVVWRGLAHKAFRCTRLWDKELLAGWGGRPTRGRAHSHRCRSSSRRHVALDGRFHAAAGMRLLRMGVPGSQVAHQVGRTGAGEVSPWARGPLGLMPALDCCSGAMPAATALDGTCRDESGLRRTLWVAHADGGGQPGQQLWGLRHGS